MDCWTFFLLFFFCGLYPTELYPCPITDDEYDEKNSSFYCKSGKVYHCFCDKNGDAKEECLQPKIIKQGCVTGFSGNRFIKVDCNGGECPKKYFSYKVNNYEACRKVSYIHNRCAIPSTKKTNDKNSGSRQRDKTIHPNSISTLRTTLSKILSTSEASHRIPIPEVTVVVSGIASTIIFLVLSAVYCKRKRSQRAREHVETSIHPVDVPNVYDDSRELQDSARIFRRNEAAAAYNASCDGEDIYDHLESKKVKLENIVSDNY